MTVFDEIACGFNRSGITLTLTHDISKVFDWQSLACYILLHNFNSDGTLGLTFGFIFLFLSNRRLQVILNGMSFHECPVNSGVQ